MINSLDRTQRQGGPLHAMRATATVISGALFGTFAALTAAAALAQAPKLVSTFSDWSSYMHEDARTKICFAVSQPKSQEPKGANRDPAFFYISAWPKDNVRTEISIKIGYPFKKGSEATVTVGSASFKLFTQNDRAFVGDAAQEVKLIDAMKKAQTMQVQGMSERGTTTTDNYSLAGLAQALQAAAEQCQ